MGPLTAEEAQAVLDALCLDPSELDLLAEHNPALAQAALKLDELARNPKEPKP